MNKNIATLILAWHTVYVSLTESIEDARVVLDQSDRGTLLPDRVREMRGKLLDTQASIPALADLLENLTGEVTWPTTDPDESLVADPILASLEPEAADELAADLEAETPAEDTEPPVTAEGDYTADGSTPVDEEQAAEDAAAEAAAEADATGTP